MYFCKCSRNEIFKPCRVVEWKPFSPRSWTDDVTRKDVLFEAAVEESVISFSDVSSIGSFSSE
jgi:hypothetical protein